MTDPQAKWWGRGALAALLWLCLLPLQTQAMDIPIDRSFTAHKRGVSAMALAPDGSVLATAGKEKVFRLFAMPAAKELRSKLLYNTILTMDLTPAGDKLLVAGMDGFLRHLTFPGYKSLSLHHFQNVYDLQAVFLPGATHALVGRSRGYGRLLLEKGAILEKWNDTGPTALAAHPERNEAYALHADRTLLIHDAATGDVLETFTLGRARPRAMALSPDGAELAIACEAMAYHQKGQPTLYVLDTASRKLRPLEKTTEGATHTTPAAIAFSADGNHLFVSNRRENNVLAVSAADGGLAATLAGTGAKDGSLPEYVSTLAPAGDGKALFGGTSMGNVLIWNVGTLQGMHETLAQPPAPEARALLGVHGVGPNLLVRFQKGWDPEGWRELPEVELGEVLGQPALEGAELAPGTGTYGGPRLTVKAFGPKHTYATPEERVAIENRLESEARAMGFQDYSAGLLPLAGNETVYLRYFNGEETVYVFYPYRFYNDGQGTLHGLAGSIEGRVDKLPDTLKAVIRSTEVMASD